MKIRFITRGRLRELINDCDMDEALIVSSFEGLGEVSYEKELKGESSLFEETALLSKKGKCVVISGCITDTRGHKRKSAVIAENGRLVGVSDMLHVIDGKVGAGAHLRVYETKIGKVGIAVGEDIHFPDVIKSLALCGSDIIVCPYGTMTSTLEQTLLRAYAYCFGVPILFCGAGYSMIADYMGNIAFASPMCNVTADFENKKEYHLIETRRRGGF